MLERQSLLCVTGEISKRFPMKVIFATVKARREYVCYHQKFNYFSETWILPIAVLFAMVAYTVFAIAFYNNWL